MAARGFVDEPRPPAEEKRPASSAHIRPGRESPPTQARDGNWPRAGLGFLVVVRSIELKRTSTM